MIRIALLGGPGSGKSTQCAHFFAKLKEQSIPVEQVQEWVHEAINKGLLPPNNPWIQFWIYEEQKSKENCIPSDIKWMVTDSPTILSYIYALMYAKRPIDNYLLLKMYENFLLDLTRYDHIFVCKREKEYLADGTRFQTKDEAIKIDNFLMDILKGHNVKYTLLTGNCEERTKIMRAEIGV